MDRLLDFVDLFSSDCSSVTPTWICLKFGNDSFSMGCPLEQGHVQLGGRVQWGLGVLRRRVVLGESKPSIWGLQRPVEWEKGNIMGLRERSGRKMSSIMNFSYFSIYPKAISLYSVHALISSDYRLLHFPQIFNSKSFILFFFLFEYSWHPNVSFLKITLLQKKYLSSVELFSLPLNDHK